MFGEGSAGHVDLAPLSFQQAEAGQEERLADRFWDDHVCNVLAEAFMRADGAIVANGRDPYFPAWPDVVQLNAFSPALRDLVVETLATIGRQCDGVPEMWVTPCAASRAT